MIPVVGGPAQGQLRQVAGADDHAAGLVGDVHEHLGALPGLTVFKGDGVVLHGLSDVPEVDLHRLADVDALQGGPQPLGQLHGVVPGAVGGAEAGHGDRDDVALRPVQQLHGHGGNEDGQGGVQAPGQPHHSGAGPGVLQPLFQPQGGDFQNLVAPLRPVLRVGGDEGVGGDVPGELGLTHLQIEGDPAHPQAVGLRHGVPGRGSEGGVAAALIGQALYVDLADGESGGKAPLRQQGAVLRDDVVAAEHQVGGGLPLPGVGVHIAAQQAARLPRHQIAAVVRLAHRLIGGGQVQNQGGARPGQGRGGGLRRPQVLADLHPDDQIGDLLTGPDQTVGQAHLLTAQSDQVVHILAGSEPPLLIKLPIVGQVDLRDQAQNLALLDQGSTVVQLAVPLVPHRQPHGGHQIQVPGGLQNGVQALLRPPEQGIL